MSKLKENIIKNTSSTTFDYIQICCSTGVIMTGCLLFMYLLLNKTPTNILISVTPIIALATFIINKTVTQKSYTIYSAICDREAVERRNKLSEIWDKYSEEFGVQDTDDPIEKRKRLDRTIEMANIEANQIRK